MNLQELDHYLKSIENDYFEYSFFSHSSEIMEAIIHKGLTNVLEVTSYKEIKKGVYNCNTLWKVNTDTLYRKDVSIDITGEMIFVTEII
ncbi:MAG: hypothetical protein N2645_08870 [Clostridia bacterium]|nr:hypothetical protein [Clostridia bacterium]